MPIKSTWYNDIQSIRLVRLGDPWTLDEFMTHKRDHFPILDASPSPEIVILWDLTETRMWPNGGLSYFQSVEGHPKVTHHIIIIGPNPLIQALMSIFQRLPSRIAPKVRLVKTFEQAEQLATQITTMQKSA